MLHESSAFWTAFIQHKATTCQRFSCHLNGWLLRTGLTVHCLLQLVHVNGNTFCFSAYRNWMNSVGVSPFVNRLYVELQDGVILFQLYDIIKSGTVDWKKVIKTFSKLKATFEKIGESFLKFCLHLCLINFGIQGTCVLCILSLFLETVDG